MRPRADFYAAMQAVLAAVPHEDGRCPFCQCESRQMHGDTCPLGRLATLVTFYGPQLPETVKARRERLLVIDRVMLDRMLHSGGRVALWCNELPDDARVVGVDTSDGHDDFVRNRPIKLIIESASYDAVLSYERPRLWGLVQTVHAEET